MALELRVEIAGDTQLRRRLLRIGSNATNLRPVFTAIANDFNEIERTQFDSEGAYASGGWKPLTSATLARKRELHQDPRVLHATLAMERSLTTKSGRGSHRVITKTSMAVTTSVRSSKGFPYPAVHQNPQRSRLPRRRPVELSPANRKRWVKSLQRFVMTGDVGI
jgi:Phage virion morphogenesis family